ncbi:MAG: hypothetical protein QOG13_1860 [Sphingomonadales bacterium]|jgi:multisubunit Na+/H+ antiporter MnhF subunit|nr:hypothetical protein [Sphingomonadales bacterium]
MNWPRPGRYAAFVSALILSVLSMVMMLNLTGDCSLDVRNCGEANRRLSFVVLGAGALALLYLLYRFIRGPRPPG